MAGNTMTYSAEYLAEDRTALVTAFYALTIPLEILSTSYRLWVKASSHSEGHLSYDDYLILWATIVAVAESTAGLVYGPPKGLGRHVQALEPGSLSEYLKGDYILSHLYDFAIASTKLSILALYYRIFGKTRMRLPILITAGFVLAWLIEMEVVLGLGCQPIQGWWDTSENPTAKCVDKVAFTYSTNVLNLIFDFWIFAMPIPVILKLNVNKAKRIALCCLFSIGLGVCSISIVRLTFVFSAGSGDVTWEEVPFGILSSLEPCGAILCANLPIIYREVVRRFKSIGKSLRGASNANYGSKELPTPYRGSVGQDWIRIDNGGKKDEPGFPKTFIARGNMADSELDLTTHGGIKVEQEFELQSRGSTRHSHHNTMV